jgi:hypothetical protein
MGDTKETRAIGQRGFLIRGANDELWFRVYREGSTDHSFTDYEITNYDCEVVIIDPHAAFISNDAGDFLDYTTESMTVSK